jgi:ankyrin repeat protein
LVRALLDTGINPNFYVYYNSRTPLQTAIARKSIEMVQLLLDRGADVNTHFVAQRYNDVETPLNTAVKTGRLDLVQLLLRVGAHVNDPVPRRKKSALKLAVQTGRLNLVQLLLDAGAEVDGPSDTRSDHPRTALQAAADIGNLATVRLLLFCGADVNAPRAIDGRTALECAARSGNVDLTQLLLFHGAIDVIAALNEAGKSGNNHVVLYIIQSVMRSHGIADDAFGRTALQAATRCCDLGLVRTLLNCGVSVNSPPTDGDTGWRTALQTAVHHGDIKITKLLLDYGADINPTTLQAAVGGNCLQLVRILLNRGANVNAPASPGGNTALAEAAHRGNPEILQLLLDWGADMNTQGASMVSLAIGNVPIELLSSLLAAWQLARGGNLDWTVNQYKRTALESAVWCDDTGLVKLLLGYGAGDKSLALREATKFEKMNVEVVELLLASGAKVGCLDGESDYSVMTALGFVAIHGRVRILRLFLEHRTCLTANEKSQALQVAALSGTLEAVRLLLNHGANVNAAPFADFTGTALQGAAGNGDLEMVRLLLEAGADVESKTSSEDEQAHVFPEQGTALQSAAIAGSMSVVALLIENGADVNAPALGKYGRTALEGAAEHGRLDMVQLLLNLGVEVTGSRAIQFAREEGHDGVVALLEEA